MAVSLLPGAEPVCACVCAATIAIDSQMGTMDATYAVGGARSFVLESQQPGTYYRSNPARNAQESIRGYGLTRPRRTMPRPPWPV